MNTNKSLSRKEREKINRRNEIQEAAIYLFATKGVNNTTLDDIAVKSEFGKGTLYNYFSSKEEIIKSIIESVLEHNLQSLKSADLSSKSFADFINTYTKKILEYCSENKNAFILLAEYYVQQLRRPHNLKDPFVKKHKEIDSILIERTEKAVKNKEIKSINTVHFHMLFHNMVFPYTLDLIHQDYLNAMSIEEQAAFISDIIFNGISKR